MDKVGTNDLRGRLEQEGLCGESRMRTQIPIRLEPLQISVFLCGQKLELVECLP